MARVKIEEIVDHLDSDMKRALGDVARRLFPDSDVSAGQLFREFRRAVGRHCSTWERVPDQYVDCD